MKKPENNEPRPKFTGSYKKKKRVQPPRKNRGEAGGGGGKGGDSRGFIKFPDNFENAKISKTQFAAFSDKIRPRYKFPDIF